MYEYELAAAPAQEWEYEEEGEWEGEWEYEGETEAFFGRLAALAQRAATSPALRRIGRSAARSALAGLSDAAGGGPAGRRLATAAARSLGGRLPQREYEGEFEGEWEEEYEVNPIRRVYPAALMEHMGHAATTAASQAEAEAFIGTLVPLAARLLPRAAPALTRAMPGLVRGLAGVARTLRSSPSTRPLLRTLPTVMRRTAASIARQSAQGRPVTPQAAVRTLARQTAQVVGNPRQATQAYRRSRAIDRRFHQQGRR